MDSTLVASAIAQSGARRRMAVMRKVVAGLLSCASLFLATNAFAQSYSLFCRGGGSRTAEIDALSFYGEVDFSVSFLPGTTGEALAFDPPQPGECRWRDRAFNSGDGHPILVFSSSSFTNLIINLNNVQSAQQLQLGELALYVENSNPFYTINLGWINILYLDDTQYWTLNVHNDGYALTIDQFLCSGYCM
jgi:hypothetical protein